MALPASNYPPPITRSDDEVLVRVEGVSKKFCRSLKMLLWYRVCDIALEINPFGRNIGQSTAYENLTTIERYGGREKEQLKVGPKGEGMGRTESKDTEETASGSTKNSSSVLISEICGQKKILMRRMAQGFAKESFYAVKDVSFELRRGELRTLGRSEKEISKKCLGATKGPDSGRSRHQCLGLIGHNGAGNQAAVQPLGRLPKAARRVRRRGKARINMTLLKMLNGLIKPDAGTITMRGRVGALIALGAGFNPILTGRENIYINGSVLGLTKKEIDAKIDEIIDFAEIREFIDMPVQSYSSGMTERLH